MRYFELIKVLSHNNGSYRKSVKALEKKITHY